MTISIRTLCAAAWLLAVTFSVLEYSPARGLDLVTSASADLNGDGKPEEIALFPNQNPDNPEFRLVAGDSFVLDSFASCETAEDFALVDLVRGDIFTEVAIHTSGPSDDHEYLIYRMVGNDLTRIGAISGRLNSIAGTPSFPGDGTVISSQWAGFFNMTRRYILEGIPRTSPPPNRDGIGNPAGVDLVEVPQKFFAVGVTAEVTAPFNLMISFDTPRPSGSYGRNSAMAFPSTGGHGQGASGIPALPTAADYPAADVPIGVAETLKTGERVMIIATFSDILGTSDFDFMKTWFLIGTQRNTVGWARLDSFFDKVNGLKWAD